MAGSRLPVSRGAIASLSSVRAVSPGFASVRGRSSRRDFIRTLLLARDGNRRRHLRRDYVRPARRPSVWPGAAATAKTGWRSRAGFAADAFDVRQRVIDSLDELVVMR